MEVEPAVLQLLAPTEAGIAVLTPAQVASRRHELGPLVDRLGEASAKAHGNDEASTSATKFACSRGNVLYLKLRGQLVVGFLKTGRRTFFYVETQGRMKEISPVSVLDFLVVCPREGVGKQLFDAFLLREQLQPAAVALDHPTAKLLSFVRKHYGLSDYLPQSNCIVVFNEYFALQTSPPRRGYRAANERRRPDSAQRSHKQASQTRRSLEPARIANTEQLKRNTRAQPRNQGQQRGGVSPPWPTGPALAYKGRRK